MSKRYFFTGFFLLIFIFFVIKAEEVNFDSGSLFTDEDVPSTSNQATKVNKDKEVTILLISWLYIFFKLTQPKTKTIAPFFDEFLYCRSSCPCTRPTQ